MRLHGLPISNYYNIAKLGLLEKGIAFEEVSAQPSQEEEFLKISPMGKIPVLETPEGMLAESQAILAYLEMIQPDPPLYPRAAFSAARTQQIHMMVDLYVDLPARALLGAAYFGNPATEEQIAEASEKLAKATTALKRLVSFSPFIAGDRITHADLAAYPTFKLASAIMTRLNQPDPLADWEGLPAYRELLSQRPAFRKAMDDQNAAMEQMFGGS